MYTFLQPEYGHLCILFFESGLVSFLRPGDLGGLVLPLAREKRLNPGADEGLSGPPPTPPLGETKDGNPSGFVKLFGEAQPELFIGNVDVLPGLATRRKAKGSFDLTQSNGDNCPD